MSGDEMYYENDVVKKATWERPTAPAGDSPLPLGLCSNVPSWYVFVGLETLG